MTNTVSATGTNYTKITKKTADKQQLSPTWVRHRWGAVKTVISTYGIAVEDTTEIDRVLRLWKNFPAPGDDSFNPTLLKPKQLRTLLSKVNTKRKAIILWALNTCSYNSDVINLTTDQLDLDNGHVSYIRTKKKVPKCGVMWDITIKAIKDRLAVRKGDSKYIFISSLSMISKDNEAMQSWPTLSHYGIICGGFTRVADCTQVFTNKQGRSFLQETGRN